MRSSFPRRRRRWQIDARDQGAQSRRASSLAPGLRGPVAVVGAAETLEGPSSVSPKRPDATPRQGTAVGTETCK
jgi:hypothetical protein